MPGLAAGMPSAPKVMSVTAKIFFVLMILLALFIGVIKPVEPGPAATEAGEHFGALLACWACPP